MKTDRVFGLLALMLVVAEVVVILSSWMVSAAFPELTVRSLISMEGVRWLFGSFVDNVGTPLLVWLVVLAMAWGAVGQSGLMRAVGDVCRGRALAYRERLGLMIVAGELVVAVVVIVLLTCVPHALLLNAMGHLFPSAFSASLVPYVAFVLTVGAISYGATSGRFESVSAVYASLVAGLACWARLVPIYVLLTLLVSSVRYVF